MQKLSETNASVIITKRNRPIATVIPTHKKKQSMFGMLQNKAEIKGDIVASINEEWNAEK